MDSANVPVFTKESLIAKLKDIAAMGWIRNARNGNDGGIGNTLEDLLGIEENNLPIPNAAEWELKTQRLGSNARVTLCHSEPSPRAIRFVNARTGHNHGTKFRVYANVLPSLFEQVVTLF